jgi:hypothetical protein
LEATFSAHFLGGSRGVEVLGSKEFTVFIKDISPGSLYSFYIVNESHNAVMIDSPETIKLQVPGEDVSRVPVVRGKVIMGTFPISDIPGEGRGQIDLPLAATRRKLECRRVLGPTPLLAWLVLCTQVLTEAAVSWPDVVTPRTQRGAHQIQIVEQSGHEGRHFSPI